MPTLFSGAKWLLVSGKVIMDRFDGGFNVFFLGGGLSLVLWQE